MGSHTELHDKQNLKGLIEIIEAFKLTDLRFLQFAFNLSVYKFHAQAFSIGTVMGMRFENFNYTIDRLKTASNLYHDNIEKTLFFKFYNQQLSNDEMNEIVKMVIEEIKGIIETKTR